MSVLVWGVASEPPIAAVLAELSQLGADIVVVHPRQLAEVDIDVEIDATRALRGSIVIDDRRANLNDISGAYIRPIEPELVPGLARRPVSDPLVVRARKAHDALIAFTEVAPSLTGCQVVNRLSSMGSNMSKPYQAQAILRHGFASPTTLITDNPDEVLAFESEFGPLIYKSISGVRSVVTEFKRATDLERLQRLRWCPVQFQERLEGPDVRVHVIGREVYAARIEAAGVDYRYSGTQTGVDAKISPHNLSPAIGAQCVRLAADLGLAFAGIDLKLVPDGRVACFEVNPSPGFSWFEQESGLPIANAVARYLLSGEFHNTLTAVCSADARLRRAAPLIG
jgi:glutathione synthase/RimK-type ligase-like ATP-grasp enzyme